ncbi:MAG: hypothetical protein EA424_18830, partial [Planctomycetaceae bacterium]
AKSSSHRASSAETMRNFKGASPWDTRRRIRQESQRDGRCPMAGAEREDGGVGGESPVGRRFGSGWMPA